MTDIRAAPYGCCAATAASSAQSAAAWIGRQVCGPSGTELPDKQWPSRWSSSHQTLQHELFHAFEVCCHRPGCRFGFTVL
jgi:hypothetical protein